MAKIHKQYNEKKLGFFILYIHLNYHDLESVSVRQWWFSNLWSFSQEHTGDLSEYQRRCSKK
jgi:hypothetical protein